MLWEGAQVTLAERESILDDFCASAAWQRVYFRWRPNLPDENDDHVLELAIAAGVEHLDTHNTRDFARGEFLARQVRGNPVLGRKLLAEIPKSTLIRNGFGNSTASRMPPMKPSRKAKDSQDTQDNNRPLCRPLNLWSPCSPWSPSLACASAAELATNRVHKEVGQKVRQTIRELCGTIVDALESGASVGGEERALSDGESAVLMVSAVTAGKFLPTEAKVVDAVDRARLKQYVKADTVMVNRANGSDDLVGSDVYVGSSYHHLFLSDKLWQIIPKAKHASGRFLGFLLSSRAFRREVLNRSSGGTGMMNIGSGSYLSIPVKTRSGTKWTKK